MLYRTFDTPTLGYIAQLAKLPAQADKTELRALQKVTHVTHNGLPKDVYHQLDLIGFPRIPPLRTQCDAARARTALQTCSVWEEEYAKLSLARDNTLPPLGCRSHIQDWDRPTPPHWDSISFADGLKHAYVYICQPLGYSRSNASKDREPHLQRNITGTPPRL